MGSDWAKAGELRGETYGSLAGTVISHTLGETVLSPGPRGAGAPVPRRLPTPGPI